MSNGVAEGPLMPRLLDRGMKAAAEGPLIKHVPGGYAEWRAKETGLPPARLVKSEDEWWGQLISPSSTIEESIVKPADEIIDTGGVDTGGIDPTKRDPNDTNYWNRVDTIAEITAPGKMWDDDSIYNLEEKLRERLKTTSDIGLGLVEPVKKPSQRVQGPVQLAPRLPLPKPELPAGPHPQILPPSKFDPGPIRVPAPAEDIESLEQGDRFRFFNDDGVKSDIASSANDVWNILDRGIKWITGPTSTDYGPRNENEQKIFKALKDWWELSGAWRREVGDPLTGGTLFETKGGKTTPRNILGEHEPAHFANLPKTLWNFYQGKEDPVVYQEYGDLHLVAIVAHAALAAQYGPVVWAAGGIMTLVPTIIDAINGATLDKPNLEGNYAQDAAHVAFWVLGNSAIKIWKNTVGKITEKIRKNPKPKTERDTLLREFEKKIKQGFEFLPKLLKGETEVIKDPELSGLYRQDTRYDVGEPIISETIGTKLAPGTPGTPTREMRKPVPTGEPSTAQPIRAEVPAEREPIIQGPTGTSGYTQIPTEVGQAAAKTITISPEPPPPPLPDDRFTSDEYGDSGIISPPPPTLPIPTVELPMGEAPKGETPFVIGEPEPPTGKTWTKEEVDAWVEEQGDDYKGPRPDVDETVDKPFTTKLPTVPTPEEHIEKTKEIEEKLVDKFSDTMIEVWGTWATKDQIKESLYYGLKIARDRNPNISVMGALYRTWLNNDNVQRSAEGQKKMRDVLPEMLRDFAKEFTIKESVGDKIEGRLDLENIDILDRMGIKLEGLKDAKQESLDEYFNSKFSEKDFDVDREMLGVTMEEVDAEGQAFKWARDEYGNFIRDKYGRLVRDYDIDVEPEP